MYTFVYLYIFYTETAVLYTYSPVLPLHISIMYVETIYLSRGLSICCRYII